MNEVWRAIEDFEEFYEVSNTGKVRSLDRVTNSNGGQFTRRGRELKQGNGRGYSFVLLTDDNKNRKNIRVHRLVAQAFIPNTENKLTVNHIDGVKSNNTSSNLEWATHKENTAHGIRTGLIEPQKANYRNGKPVLIAQIDKQGKIVARHINAVKAAAAVGTDSKTILKVCSSNPKFKSSKGYKWEYIPVE